MKDVISAAKYLAQHWTTHKTPKVSKVGETAEFSIRYEGEDYVCTVRFKPVWTMK